MKYCIDIGHNMPGVDEGANGIKKEDPLNLAIGNKLINKLNAADQKVINSLNYAKSLYRPGMGRTKELDLRCEASNINAADLFVSIHCNKSAKGDGSGQGVEVWYYSNNGYEMALKVCAQVAKLGFVNRGPKKIGVDGKSLYVIKNTKAVAILIECGFIDNKHDMDLLDPETMSGAIFTALTGRKDTVSAAGINAANIKVLQRMMNSAGIKDMYKNKLDEDGVAGQKTIYCLKVLYDLLIQLKGAR